MPFDIKKVLIANIKVEGVSTTFPILHIVVNNRENVDLDSFYLRSFVSEVYSKTNNFTVLCGAWKDTTFSDEWQGLTTGTYTYGGDTGFKLQIQIGRTNNKTNIVRVTLYHNNMVITTAKPKTGYSNAEFVFPFFITDLSNNLFRKVSSGSESPFDQLEEEPLATNVIDGVYLVSNYMDSLFKNYYERKDKWIDDLTFIAHTWSYTGNDISNDIDSEVDPNETDPYDPNANPGGGGGETQTPDSITDPALPTITSVDTGFITLYKPSISQLNNLATWMWGSLDVDIFKRVMQSPMDAILGLSILPGIVPSGSSSNVKIGNIDSGISMTKVSTQYVKFDCGSLTIKRKWGAFLDYSPYTKSYLYLPFIGIRSIETDSIMGVEVQVKYNIDVMSGACCAFVIANGTTLYSFTGQCSCSVPVTGRDWTNMINGVLGAVSGVASAAGSAASGNLLGAVSGIASAASSALSAKPTIEHSGNMGGMGGLMGIKRPYFIIERPVQAVPGYQNEIIGYPSFVYKFIGQSSGYTEFEQIHLEGLPCTSEELNEIENILLTGVIL